MRTPSRRLVTPLLAGALALTGAVALAPAANAAPAQAASVHAAPARASLGVSVVKDAADSHYYSAKVTVTNRGTSTADRWNVQLTPRSNGTSFQVYSLDGTPLKTVRSGSGYSISTEADLPAGSSASFLYVVLNATYAQPSVRVS